MKTLVTMLVLLVGGIFIMLVTQNMQASKEKARDLENRQYEERTDQAARDLRDYLRNR
jgi:hypothetical protein